MPVKLTTNFAKTAASWRNRISLELNSANRSQVSVAQQLVPKDTGLSERTISVLEEATVDNLRAVSHAPAQKADGTFYDIYPEFGTIYQDAQPFWTPAFALARMQLLNSLRTLGGRSKVDISYGVTNLTNPDTFVSR